MSIRSSYPRIRSTLIALAVAALTVAGMATLVARTTTAGAAVTAGVEDSGANCAVSLPSTLTSNAKLPDPFKKLDGTRITTQSDWTCRREEIEQLAEKYVYGTKPAKPATVTGTVSRTSVTVNVSDNGRSASFSASVSLPSGTGPFPSVVVFAGLGADTSTIQGAGVAVINYNPLSVGAEGTPRTNKQGAFYTLYGSSSSTGLLMAWAWGVSRIIDVIQQSDGSILKADAMGVTGCSRYGKGAFVTGAFDQRIALTMPIESGSGGAPIFRGIPGESGSQPLSSAYSEQPWLGDAFNAFTGNPNTLPVDTHEMVAMVAPRGLFMMENPHIDWLAAKSGSVAALGGAEVYKALGAGDNISYWSDIQDGTHCAVRPEWKTPLQQNLQKFLLKTGNAAGVIRISSLKSGNLADWRDWTTPTLTGGTPTSAPPTSTPPTSTPPTTTPPTSAPPTTPSSSCTATMVAGTVFGDRYNTTVNVTGSSNWIVTVTITPPQKVSSTWNTSASWDSSGNVMTARPNGNGNSFGFTTMFNGNSSARPRVSCRVG